MPGGDDDGDIGVRPNLAEQIEPVLLTESEIEDHEAGLCGRELFRHIASLAGGDDVHVMFFEIALDHLSDCGVVVDEQNARPSASIGFRALDAAARKLAKTTTADRACQAVHHRLRF